MVSPCQRTLLLRTAQVLKSNNLILAPGNHAALGSSLCFETFDIRFPEVSKPLFPHSHASCLKQWSDRDYGA